MRCAGLKNLHVVILIVAAFLVGLVASTGVCWYLRHLKETELRGQLQDQKVESQRLLEDQEKDNKLRQNSLFDDSLMSVARAGTSGGSVNTLTRQNMYSPSRAMPKLVNKDPPFSGGGTLPPGQPPPLLPRSMSSSAQIHVPALPPRRIIRQTSLPYNQNQPYQSLRLLRTDTPVEPVYSAAMSLDGGERLKHALMSRQHSFAGHEASESLPRPTLANEYSSLERTHTQLQQLVSRDAARQIRLDADQLCAELNKAVDL